MRPPGTMDISNAQSFRHPLGDLRSKWCPIVTLTWANQISECFHGAALPPPQSRWKSLQSIWWMYPSWLTDIYTLEKLASEWSPSASPLLGRSHIIGWAGPAGVFEILGGCLIGRWDKRRSLALQSFGGLLLWRIFLVIFGRPFPLSEWWHVRS